MEKTTSTMNTSTTDNTSTKNRPSGLTYCCSYCGEVGHNARTCAIKALDMLRAEEEAKALEAAKNTKNRPSGLTYKCSYCGKVGHNSRNCPTKQLNASLGYRRVA